MTGQRRQIDRERISRLIEFLNDIADLREDLLKKLVLEDPDEIMPELRSDAAKLYDKSNAFFGLLRDWKELE